MEMHTQQRVITDDFDRLAVRRERSEELVAPIARNTKQRVEAVPDRVAST
jgi:hypothetical protein